jgi:hypothetical protein
VPLTLFHDARLEPFLDQADHASIPNPMFHKLDQPTVLEFVEGNSHTLPITRIFLQPSPSLDRIMPLKVSRLLFRGEFIGKVEPTYC